jgi:hypothetical protein
LFLFFLSFFLLLLLLLLPSSSFFSSSSSLVAVLTCRESINDEVIYPKLNLKDFELYFEAKVVEDNKVATALDVSAKLQLLPTKRANQIRMETVRVVLFYFGWSF